MTNQLHAMIVTGDSLKFEDQLMPRSLKTEDQIKEYFKKKYSNQEAFVMITRQGEEIKFIYASDDVIVAK